MARAHPRKAWAALKAAYRRGEGSLRDLALEHGIPDSTVMKRAAREKWEAERQQVSSAAEARAVERDVESVAQMLAKHRRVAARIAELVEKQIEAEARGGKISANKLDVLSGVLARMAPVERLAAGLEQSKPVQAGAAEGPRTRILYRNGAAVPAVAPEKVASAPVVPIAGKAGTS
jgi:hypothetical protein